MNMTIEQIAEQALALPIDARMLLADQLVESLDPADDAVIQQLWVSESLRRRDEVRSGQVLTIPSDVALDKIKRAFA